MLGGRAYSNARCTFNDRGVNLDFQGLRTAGHVLSNFGAVAFGGMEVNGLLQQLFKPISQVVELLSRYLPGLLTRA